MHLIEKTLAGEITKNGQERRHADGTALTRAMRAMRHMHQRYPMLPFYVTGKKISLEDVRLVLEKMPDRFHEHPATVLVITNLYYSEGHG